jgi:excisionase family DNA binding protein
MKPQFQDDDLMTMGEVAKRLRITEGTLRNWRMRGGGPPAHVFGRKALFRRSDVDAYINDQFEAPVAAPEFTPPSRAPARGRYFPWSCIAETVADAVAEVLGTNTWERNQVRNAVFDALPAAYETYMGGVIAHAGHDTSESEAVDRLRDELTVRLRPLRESRAANAQAS